MQKVQTKRRKHHAVKAGDTTINISITNNTDADVVVIHSFTDNGQSVDQLYELSLKTLQTTDGGTVIKKGATGSLTLNHAAYKLIIARADNLFPVKTASVPLDSSTQTDPSLTVTMADADNMKLAAKFQQMITAFSTADLAAGFAAALADSDATKATAFFIATGDYKTLSIDDVVAVQTYYTVYPFVWTYYNDEKSYSLYATDGTSNKKAGSLTLRNECNAPVNPGKSLPGFSITYTKEGSTQPLYYSNGQFVDDVTSASPGICLQGIFTSKSGLTKNDLDKAIVAVLAGTINGESILGYDLEQAFLQNTLTDVPSTLDILLHPDDTKSWLELTGAILATVLGLAVLCKAVAATLEWASRSNPLTPTEIRDRIRQTTQQNLDRIKSLGIEGRNKLKIPEDVTASLGSIKKQGNDLLLKENKTKMQDIVTQQSDMLERLAKYGVNNELQTVFDNLDYINSTLLDTNAVDLSDSMSSLVTGLKNNTTAINSQVGKVRSKLGTDERNAVEAAKDANDRLTRQVESNEKLRSDLAEDKSPEERTMEELFETF